MIVPPPLRPGSRIQIVAPSSPFDRDQALQGIAWLSSRYEVAWDESLFSRHGFLAGSDDRRRDELARAFEDRSIGAIVATRGGYGLSRIAHELPWDALLASPKWIVGFSDITALHLEAAARGLASMHAPMVCALGRGSDADRARFVELLEHPLAERRFDGLVTIHPGAAEGPLFGGNLCLLHAAAASNRLRVPEGAIVLLEDVGERPYRVDRMLTNLLVGGHFEKVAGIVLGDFTDCDPGPDGVTVEEVLRERLERLGLPVATGLPVGHGKRNEGVVLGARARLDASCGTFVVGGDA